MATYVDNTVLNELNESHPWHHRDSEVSKWTLNFQVQRANSSLDIPPFSFNYRL